MRRSRLANVLIAIAVGVVTLAGLVAHGALGTALLVIVAAALVTLSASAWPTIPGRGRTLRVVVVIGLLAIAGAKSAGGL
ncbi:MAG TPA: DUF6703 family protein [Mycobacteriales bacterium]|nr:DUF6703 family protein [Mycobacteriales bacterium]